LARLKILRQGVEVTASTAIPNFPHAHRNGMRSTMQRPPLMALAGVSGLLLVVAFLMGPDYGRFSLATASLGGIGVVVLLDFGMRQVAPDLLLPRLMSAAYGFQLPFLIAIAVTGATVDPMNTMGHIDFADAPLTAVLPNLVVPLAAFCATFFVACISRPALRGRNVWQQTEDPPAGIEAYFVIGAVFHVGYWFSVSETAGIVAYFVRVGHTSMMVMPFFVGRYARKLRITRFVWLTVIPIVSVMGFLTGERFDALVPPALYMLGYVISVPPAKRRSALLIAALAGTVLLSISGLLGAVRGIIGRGGADRASSEFLSGQRVRQTLDTAMYVMTTPSNDAAMREESFGRMISWPNFAVARFSPESVPYKGWTDFPQHIKLMLFDLSLITGSTLQDRLDLGVSTAGAIPYGYYVSETNSVDFGLLGDGWSRAGAWGCFIFGFVLAAWLALLERAVWLFKGIAPVAPLLLFMIWAAISLYVCSVPFLNGIRASVLSAGYWLVIVFIVEIFRSSVSRRSKVNLSPFGG
jgi:hypothetical protein